MGSWLSDTLSATLRSLARTATTGGLVLVAAVCTDDVTGPEDLDVDQDQVIFVSSRGDTQKGIYRMNADGTGSRTYPSGRVAFSTGGRPAVHASPSRHTRTPAYAWATPTFTSSMLMVPVS